jgi:tRNA(adenine34) deaminase
MLLLMPKCKPSLLLQIIGGKYLTGCTLYVTLSLARCVLALCWSQFKIVYGASDENRGFVKNGNAIAS